MNIHADKAQESKNQSVSVADSQMQNGVEPTFQFVDNRPETIVQRKRQEIANNSPQAKQTAQLRAIADNHSAQQQQPTQRKENNTGLPDNLKTGMESLSGVSLDDVKVHRNSDKPAQLLAHAYAQGTDIHLGPGQDKHLPHEAWHVVQQKQGRVKPTMQMKDNVNVNDDAGLEKEADVMGAKAIQFKGNHPDHTSYLKKQDITDNKIPCMQTTYQLYCKQTAALNLSLPVLQLKTVYQGYINVIREIAEEIGGSVGNILGELAELTKLDPENAEQGMFFSSAWKGSATEDFVTGDDRVMKENLIQSNLYGVGDYLKKSRLESDKTDYLNFETEIDKENIYEAFQNALFFRAEREDSKASTNGYLKYDEKKHGKNGSASDMPGRNAEKVKERAEGNLFVSKNRKEAMGYAKTAQGGKREVLNIIASRTEVGLMQYDVDSGGFKTPENLTGIFKNTITEDALDNLNTWLPANEEVSEAEANLILTRIMK